MQFNVLILFVWLEITALSLTRLKSTKGGKLKDSQMKLLSTISYKTFHLCKRIERNTNVPTNLMNIYIRNVEIK